MQNACTLEIALSDEFLNFAFRIFQSKCKLCHSILESWL